MHAAQPSSTHRVPPSLPCLVAVLHQQPHRVRRLYQRLQQRGPRRRGPRGRPIGVLRLHTAQLWGTAGVGVGEVLRRSRARGGACSTAGCPLNVAVAFFLPTCIMVRYMATNSAEGGPFLHHSSCSRGEGEARGSAGSSALSMVGASALERRMGEERAREGEGRRLRRVLCCLSSSSP